MDERVDKVDNALEGQTQSLRQSLVLRFSPDTPFSTKTSSANGFAVAHRCFSFEESLRRRMSAYVTNFNYHIKWIRTIPKFYKSQKERAPRTVVAFMRQCGGIFAANAEVTVNNNGRK